MYEKYFKAAFEFSARQLLSHPADVAPEVNVWEVLTAKNNHNSDNPVLPLGNTYLSYSPELLEWEIQRLSKIYSESIQDAFPPEKLPHVYDAFNNIDHGKAYALFSQLAWYSTTNKKARMFEIEEYSINLHENSYFSFSILIPGDKTFTNWMIQKDGVIYDAAWADDEIYQYESFNLPISPLIHISAPPSSFSDVYRPILLSGFLRAIKEKTGIVLNVPILCEGREMDQVVKLKADLGYNWCGDCVDFVPANKGDELNQLQAKISLSA